MKYGEVVALCGENGAVGRMWTSPVNAGCLDGNRIRIVGSKASVEWRDREPDFASYEVQGEPQRRLYRSMGYLSRQRKSGETPFAAL